MKNAPLVVLLVLSCVNCSSCNVVLRLFYLLAYHTVYYGSIPNLSSTGRLPGTRLIFWDSISGSLFSLVSSVS